jgi:hypothetical protein
MTELIKSKNHIFNDINEINDDKYYIKNEDFNINKDENNDDFEIDENLQNFMDFVKNKENKKITEQTNYVI